MGFHQKLCSFSAEGIFLKHIGIVENEFWYMSQVISVWASSITGKHSVCESKPVQSCPSSVLCLLSYYHAAFPPVWDAPVDGVWLKTSPGACVCPMELLHLGCLSPSLSSSPVSVLAAVGLGRLWKTLGGEHTVELWRVILGKKYMNNKGERLGKHLIFVLVNQNYKKF